MAPVLAVLLELVLAFGAGFVGLLGSTIGVGLLGDAEYTWLALITTIPLGILGLVLALLYAVWRPRFARPLRWSILAALLGALLMIGYFLAIGSFGDLESLVYLCGFALPAPLLQGLLSGVIAQVRKRSVQS